MEDPEQFFMTNQPSWPSPEFNPPYRQEATIDPTLLNTQVSDFPDADLGGFAPADSTGFRSQAPRQDRAGQKATVDGEVDRKIVELLRCATPTTKESILHLLRRSARASGDSKSSGRQASADPADEELLEPLVRNATYQTLGHHSRNGCLMLSPLVDTSFDPGHEPYEFPSTQQLESMGCLKTRPRPTTLPAPSNEPVQIARQMAAKPYYSTPDPFQPPLPIHRPIKTLGGSVMTSQSSFHQCKCGTNCGTKGDLERHRKGPCSLTKDKIQFTCLLYAWAPTCDRPCPVELHQNACSPACEHRPERDESREIPYRNYRADKMRTHLRDNHGWRNFSQRDIPKSWTWPLRWSPLATDRSGRVWACELCNEHLGTWEEDKDRINQHCQDCPKGTDARAVRFSGSNRQQLRVQSTKGITGASLRDDDIEMGEYSPTSKHW